MAATLNLTHRKADIDITLTSAQVDELAANLYDDAMRYAADLYEADGREDVAYACRKGIRTDWGGVGEGGKCPVP